MPQLDYIFFIAQLFWLGIITTCIFMMVRFIIYPKFENLFAIRKNIIDQNLHAAETARLQAEEIEQYCIIVIAEAKQKAAILLSNTEKELKQKAALEHQKLNEVLRQEAFLAEQKIAKFKQEAPDLQLKQLKIELTRILTHEILGETIDKEKIEFLIQAEETYN